MSDDQEWIITTNVPSVTFGVMAETHDDAIAFADAVLTDIKITSATRTDDPSMFGYTNWSWLFPEGVKS